MLRPGGYSQVWDGDGKLTEADTFTCKHCQRVHKVKPGHGVDYDFCRNCMGAICPRCAGKTCLPFQRRLEIAEAAGRMLRDMGFHI